MTAFSIQMNFISNITITFLYFLIIRISLDLISAYWSKLTSLHVSIYSSLFPIGRFVYDPEVAGDGMSVVSRRCHSRVDCVGASKGLFCGLLVLVASLICLILFFVLVNRDELKMLAIYLADCSHCGIMFFSIIAMFIGFFRYIVYCLLIIYI